MLQPLTNPDSTFCECLISIQVSDEHFLQLKKKIRIQVILRERGEGKVWALQGTSLGPVLAVLSPWEQPPCLPALCSHVCEVAAAVPSPAHPGTGFG